MIIRPQEVLLFGRDLLSLHDSAHFRTAIGSPSRHRNIKMHPTGVRVALVWDHIGLVAYEDLPEGKMSHLCLAFNTAETPEHPLAPSEVLIEINGALLTADTTERTMPVNGVTPISADFGGRYCCRLQQGVVDFMFERRRDSSSKKSEARRLAFVSFSWPSLS